MGKPMRIALVLFAVAAALSLGLLATLWFAWDPLLPAALALASASWFDAALLGLLAVTAAGVVAALVVAIVTPGTRAGLSLAHDGGKVTIAKDAIRSTATQVIEHHGNLTCKRVSVRILGRRDPHIRIKARVDPADSENLSLLGTRLQDEVASRVESLTGRPVKTVDISFARPSKTPPLTTRRDEKTARAAHHAAQRVPRTA